MKSGFDSDKPSFPSQEQLPHAEQAQGDRWQDYFPEDPHSQALPSEEGMLPAPNETVPSDPEVKLEASAPPTLEDFEWYWEVKENGIWPEAVAINDFSDWTGTWKGMTAYMEGMRPEDVYARELFTATLSGTPEDATLVMDLHQMYWANEGPSDESGMQFVYSGGWNDEFQSVELTGPGNLSLVCFVSYQGREYAWCSLLTPSGEMGDVLLTRP